MNNSHFIPSTLHVTATQIDVSKDLTTIQTKSLGELLEEETQKKEPETQAPEETQEAG